MINNTMIKKRTKLEVYEINLGQVDKIWAESVGHFIRQTYFLNKKVFRCCGLSGNISIKGREPVELAPNTTLPGNNLIYDLILNINRINLSSLGKYENMEIGGEQIVEPVDNKTSKLVDKGEKGQSSKTNKFTEEVAGIGEDLNKIEAKNFTTLVSPSIKRLSEEMFAIHVLAMGKHITTEVFGEILDSDEIETIVQDFSDVTLDLTVYMRYSNGTFSDEASLTSLKYLDREAFTFPIICSPNGDFGYDTVIENGNCKLVLFLESKFISSDEVKEICNTTIGNMINSLDKIKPMDILAADKSLQGIGVDIYTNSKK